MINLNIHRTKETIIFLDLDYYTGTLDFPCDFCGYEFIFDDINMLGILGDD